MEVFKSTSGGSSWNLVNNWWDYYGNESTMLHADIPEVRFFLDPDFNEVTLVSTDGGLYFSNDNLEIFTSSGSVVGSITNKVISWDDIPYAEPPVGELRWKAPRDYKNDSNIIISKVYNFCVQEPSRLVGAEGELGAAFGLDNDWSLRIIKQVGNYGESYKRNIADTGILPDRGPNQLWTKGGILYVPPAR